MSQLDLDDMAGEAQGGNASTGIDDISTAEAPAAVLTPPRSQTTHSTYQGVVGSRSLLTTPTAGIKRTETSAVDSGRRVGFQYLSQLCLTGGPLVAADLALLAAVVLVARQMMLFIGWAPGLDLSTCAVPIATGFLLIAAEMGLYPGIRLSPVEEFRRLAMAVTSIFAVWIVGVTMLSGGLSLQRIVFLTTAYLMYLVSLPICRGMLRRLLATQSWWGFRTLVCGSDAAVVKLHDWLAQNRRLGLRPVGVIADREDLEIDGDESWYAGQWSAVQDVAIKKGVYWAVIVPPENRPTAVHSLIVDYLYSIPHVHVLSEFTGLPEHWNPQQLEGLAGVHLQQNLMLPLPRLTKRCIDLVASLVGSLLLLPLLFYIAVAVKMSSRGPILYGHERIGKHGRRFRAWKFRSMFQDANLVLDQYLNDHPELMGEWNRDHKLRYDPRITRIGRFMRKTSLDELPQLWNVIRGDMSLVGPRPIVTAEIAKYGPYYGLYTMVTPGITGLWQVSGRNNTTYEERVQLDAYYVRNWSPWMDLYLLIRTIRIVLFAKGAY